MPVISDKKPKYERLAEDLQAKIKTKELSPGHPLPSVRNLMVENKMSMTTVVKGLKLLQDRNFIESQPQRGYFVSDRFRTQALTGQIAFITPALGGDTNLYIKGFHQTLDPARFTLATYSTNGNLDQFHEIIERVVRFRPSGMIITTLPEEFIKFNTEALEAFGIPIVLIGSFRTPLLLSCDRVTEQYQSKARRIVQYMVEKNYRDPALLLSGSVEANSEFVRWMQIELERMGISLPAENILTSEASHGFMDPPNPCFDAEEMLSGRLAEGFRCQTLICEHDYPAVGALQAFLKAGISIPGDVKVISAATCSVEGFFPMKLTTLEVHRDIQARMAADLLIRRIDGYRGLPEIHYAPADLVVGETG